MSIPIVRNSSTLLTTKTTHWSNSINLDLLDHLCLNLSELGDRFTEEEVWGIICSLPLDKAQGQDGFSGRFSKVPWPINMADLMRAFDAFWSMDTQNFHSINEALLTLLPKIAEASALNDYQLVSPIHSLGKLFSEVLATRLAPRLDNMVHDSQSAFIKGRLIQDNFHFVQASTKLLHACNVGDVPKRPS
jgi:hypothetical protein